MDEGGQRCDSVLAALCVCLIVTIFRTGVADDNRLTRSYVLDAPFGPVSVSFLDSVVS